MVLSFLACNDFSCEVLGTNEVQRIYEAAYGPGDYVPLMVVTYWAFRVMMTIGFLMILVTAFFLYAYLKGKVENAKWLKWAVWGIALPYLANMSGWILTEMGRQPWIVQGLLKVQDAVSPYLTTLDLLISLIGYTLVYGTLAVAMVYLMKKYAVAGPDAAMHESVDVAPALVGSDD
jgi:cytochrome d ubiquinol oxidase subunit I